MFLLGWKFPYCNAAHLCSTLVSLSLVLSLLHISPNHPPLLWMALTVLDIWRLVSPLAMFLSLQASTGLNPKGLARPKSVTFWCKLVSLMQSRQPKTWFLQRGHMLVLCSGTCWYPAEIRYVSTAWISSAESLNQRFCCLNPIFFFVSQQKNCLFGSDGQEFRRVKTRCLGLLARPKTTTWYILC